MKKKSAYADRATADGIALEHAGLITGTAEMYDLPLPRGTAEELGRSHGFFVKVLERLMNVNDETFGIDVELHHGVFTRFRAEVNIIGLDDVITATRELRHLRTKPHRRRTNGKVERFIQTLEREWAYGLTYASSVARAARSSGAISSGGRVMVTTRPG